jgi:DNA replication protein DnaC
MSTNLSQEDNELIKVKCYEFDAYTKETKKFQQLPTYKLSYSVNVICVKHPKRNKHTKVTVKINNKSENYEMNDVIFNIGNIKLNNNSSITISDNYDKNKTKYLVTVSVIMSANEKLLFDIINEHASLPKNEAGVLTTLKDKLKIAMDKELTSFIVEKKFMPISENIVLKNDLEIHVTAEGKRLLRTIEDNLPSNNNITIIGPSGIGKSFSMLFIYFYLKLAKGNRVLYFDFTSY